MCTQAEICNVDVSENEVNKPVSLPCHMFYSMDEVIVALQNSTSEITLYTSGTTGQPKKVLHTIMTLARSVRTGDKYRNQIWAFAYNPTHMAGLQVFFQAFENLNTLVNVFNMHRLDVYRAFEKYHVTHISATPTFYRLLLPYEVAYPAVTRVTLGGEKSDTHLYELIRRIFPNARINNVYASTEAGTLFVAKGSCFQIPADIRDKFKIENNELLIHRSLLGKSNSFNFQDDYYCSGDLIEWVDQDNCIFKFISRKNELINVGGYKVNPGEVEEALLKLSDVLQTIVYGKENSVLGNILCADIILMSSSTLTVLDVRRELEKSLQDFKIPRKIRFVDSLSLTRTGKLKRL